MYNDLLSSKIEKIADVCMLLAGLFMLATLLVFLLSLLLFQLAEPALIPLAFALFFAVLGMSVLVIATALESLGK